MYYLMYSLPVGIVWLRCSQRTRGPHGNHACFAERLQSRDWDAHWVWCQPELGRHRRSHAHSSDYTTQQERGAIWLVHSSTDEGVWLLGVCVCVNQSTVNFRRHMYMYMCVNGCLITCTVPVKITFHSIACSVPNRRSSVAWPHFFPPFFLLRIPFKPITFLQGAPT